MHFIIPSLFPIFAFLYHCFGEKINLLNTAETLNE